MDLVIDGLLPHAAVQLALEEALVRCAPAAPLLRLWRDELAVVVGRFQDVRREVALADCAHDGVAVVRRASGGGTVVHDLGTLNVSVTLPGRVPEADVRLAAVLTGALARLGVPVHRRPRGLFVAERKIAGLAMMQTATATLAHATLLVTTRAATVARYLTPQPAVADRTDSHRAAVTSLREHGVDADVAAVAAVIRAAADVTLRPRPLTQRERRMHNALLDRRYRDDYWHLTGRPKEGAWTTQLVSGSTA